MRQDQLSILRADWPAPGHVQALCSTRSGGVSRGCYESLNLGDHVGDEPHAVAANRDRFTSCLQARPVFMKQVHGCGVAELGLATADGVEADGCWTSVHGVACTIMVADCLPVLFTDFDGRAVAAAHAGWRGLAGHAGQGILEATWERFHRAPGPLSVIDPGQTLAWLGPCIGPEAFEVGSEVKDAFTECDSAAGALFKPHAPGKYLADLQGLARLRLRALGIERIYGNDGSRAWCTVSNPSRFFSHRRDRVSGRFAASIWLA